MRRLSAIVAIVTLVATTAYAQGTQTLSLDRAIQIALENNHDLKAARLEIDKADAQVSEAFGNALPSLSFNTRYTYNLQQPVFYIPGGDGIVRPIKIGSKQGVTADLTLNQILFNSAVFTGVGTAETYSKISRQQLRAEASDVVLNVRKAYYGAALARQFLDVSEALLQNAEDTYKNAQALYKAGLRAEFDAIRAEVQVANQRPVVVQARDNYNQAIDGLKLVLGMSQEQKLELSDTLASPETSTVVEPQIEEATKLLEEYNAQLKALALNEEVNRKFIDLYRSDYLPTLSLFGTYEQQAQSDNLADFEFQPTSYVGLNLSLNIFNGGKTAAQVEQARVDMEKSRVQLDQARSGLKTQLESVLRRIAYARERIESSQKTIEQAEKGYKIAEATYKAGTGTQLQINDADLALAQSRWNRLTAVYDYHVALAELEQLIGRRYELTPDGKNVEYNPN